MTEPGTVETIGSFLRYDVLGILALVLVGIFLLSREWLKWQNARQAADAQAQAEERKEQAAIHAAERKADEERRVKQDLFMQSLIEGERAERNAFMASMNTLVQNMIEVETRNGNTMALFCAEMQTNREAMERHNAEAVNRHTAHEKNATERYRGIIDAIGE